MTVVTAISFFLGVFLCEIRMIPYIECMTRNPNSVKTSLHLHWIVVGFRGLISFEIDKSENTKGMNRER